MKKLHLSLIAVFATGLISACDSQAVNTLDELTISSSNDGGLQKPVSFSYPLQSRFLSVNGQLPIAGPASSCLASSLRVANSIICFNRNQGTEVLVKDYVYEGTLADMIAIRDSLTDLQLTVAQLVAEDANSKSTVAPTAQKVTEKVTRINDSLSKNNLFVFRWASSAGGNAGGNAGSLFTARGAAEKVQSGLVIVGGLRVSSLMFDISQFESDFGNLPSGAKIATVTMAADHLLYFTNANLGVSVDAALDGDLASFKEDISPETQIALNAYAQLSNAQENQGLFSAPAVSRKTLEEVSNDNDTKQIFYATMTDVETLRKALNE